jgi:Sigma-70 region 2
MQCGTPAGAAGEGAHADGREAPGLRSRRPFDTRAGRGRSAARPGPQRRGARAARARAPPRLLHAARHRCSRPQDAEDAVQEALRIALERRATIRPATAFAYVATIAMHESSRLRRLAERTRSLDAPIDAGGRSY